MVIKKHTHLIQFFLACLIILMPVTIGCKKQIISERTLPSADDIEALAAQFNRLSIANLSAGDVDQLRKIYTQDIIYHDANQDLGKGIDSLIEFTNYFLYGWPEYENRLVNTFIGRGDGFYFEESWGWLPKVPMENIFNSGHPIKTYMWLNLRDGKISYWWLFYGEEILSVADITFDSKILQDYATAWSSGNPVQVAHLYAADAIRQDALFSENQQGTTAIKKFATDFFAWYPGIRLILLESFGEYPQPIKKGGVYSLHVVDSYDRLCDIEALILIEADESQQKITHEWVFYDAYSLTACGWAE